MGSRRRNILVVIPFALAVAVPMAATAPADANPLLSGYGGPGQGEQAVLGATVLNTPSGGGGGSSSSGGSAEPSAASLTVPGGATKATRAARPSRRHHPSAGTGQAANARTPSPAAVPSGGLVRDAAATSSSGGTLGLSAGDVVYLLLALAALALAGGLTRQLARRPH